MGRIHTGRSETGPVTLGEVLDGLEDPRGSPGQVREVRKGVGRPSGRSRTGQGTHRAVSTGRGTLGEVRNGSDTHGWSWTVRGTLGAVRDGSGDPWGDLGRVGGTSMRSGMGWGPTGWSWMGRGTFRGHTKRSWTGRGTIPLVRDRSGDSRIGLGRAEGPSGKYETGRGTLGEVRDG